MENIFFAQIFSSLRSIRTGLTEGVSLLKRAGDDSAEIFSKFAGEIELIEGTVGSGMAIRVTTQETSALHMALESAHDSAVWIAAFSTLQWYHTLDVDIRTKFRALADSAEALLDDIDRARKALPYDKVSKENLN